VYYIPRLRINILSLGQMDEIGCDTHIRHGWLRLRDANDRLLACVRRNKGWLYILHLTSTRPVCLLASGTDPAWLWHARYGHLNFRVLRELGHKDMASGIPLLDRLDQVCDGCALGKKHRHPFP
jgi:hypothetical protein